MMNKRGFTLMELLVYMAIVGIVVVIAGQVYSDSTKMRIRTQSMISANEVAENVGVLLRDDVAQMGAKNSKDQNNFILTPEVFMDPTNNDETLIDSSSFRLTKNAVNGKQLDNLYFRRVRYDESGRYVSVEAVSWYVDNGSLYRSCQTIANSTLSASYEDCPKDKEKVVLVAEGLEQFKVVPSKPSILSSTTNTILLPEGDNTKFKLLSRVDGSKYFRAATSPENGGKSVAVSSFVSNYDFENDETTNEKKVNELYVGQANGNPETWSNCSKVSLEPGTMYELTYNLPRISELDRSQTFVPGKDHMAVGFRTADGNVITHLNDFFFYPSTSEMAGTINRNIRFQVKSKVEEACMVFVFAAYTPLMASGSITISNLQLRKISDIDYVFEDDYVPENTADKALVRAFQLNVIVAKNKERGQVTIEVPVLSNGPAR